MLGRWKCFIPEIQWLFRLSYIQAPSAGNVKSWPKRKKKYVGNAKFIRRIQTNWQYFRKFWKPSHFHKHYLLSVGPEGGILIFLFCSLGNSIQFKAAKLLLHTKMQKSLSWSVIKTFMSKSKPTLDHPKVEGTAQNKSSLPG